MGKPSSNSIRVIAPYWHSGTWVFDDPAVGLVREPFVSGAPEILSRLAEPIAGARSGFRLLFADSPFPGFQAEFELARAEYGGIWYREAREGAEGWLCPALFKYFEEAPRRLFVRAEALAPEPDR
jgi:hypothetical protein